MIGRVGPGSLRVLTSTGPFFRQQFRLLQDVSRSSFLLVGWIAALAQDASDKDRELGPGVLPHHPIYVHVGSDCGYQFSGYAAQRIVSQDFHGAAVGFQGVIKRELLFGQPQRFAAGVGRADVFGQGDKLLDSLGGFER